MHMIPTNSTGSSVFDIFCLSKREGRERGGARHTYGLGHSYIAYGFPLIIRASAWRGSARPP
jgi:hypothetical protein